MPKILNFHSPRVLQLMRQIEIERDRETLAQLFLELNLVLNQNDRKVRSGKKSRRSVAPVKSDGENSR